MSHPSTSPTIITMSPAGLPWVTDAATMRRLRPAIISGAAVDTDGDTSDGGDDGGDDEGSDNDGPTYTKQQVDSMLGRHAKKAQQQAAKDLAEQLGMSVADAKAFIEAKRKAETESMSEADRKLEAAQQAQAAADAAMANAKRLALNARVEAKLARMQLDDKAIGVVAPALGLDEDADDSDIDAAIAAMRENVPQLFTGTTPNGAGTAPPPSSSNGGTRRKNTPPPASSFEAGLAAGKEYAERYKQPGTADVPVF